MAVFEGNPFLKKGFFHSNSPFPKTLVSQPQYNSFVVIIVILYRYPYGKLHLVEVV